MTDVPGYINPQPKMRVVTPQAQTAKAEAALPFEIVADRKQYEADLESVIMGHVARPVTKAAQLRMGIH